jgi:hypothetical protein
MMASVTTNLSAEAWDVKTRKQRADNLYQDVTMLMRLHHFYYSSLNVFDDGVVLLISLFWTLSVVKSLKLSKHNASKDGFGFRCDQRYRMAQSTGSNRIGAAPILTSEDEERAILRNFAFL